MGEYRQHLPRRIAISQQPVTPKTVEARGVQVPDWLAGQRVAGKPHHDLVGSVRQPTTGLPVAPNEPAPDDLHRIAVAERHASAGAAGEQVRDDRTPEQLARSRSSQ